MSETKNTAEIQAQLTSALDYMMAADSQNSNKHIKVREWFAEVFHADGRASRVSETKQAYNRVPEQFKHRDPHVIFIVDDDGTGAVIEAQAKAKQYSGLDTCLVLKNSPKGYSAVVLMMASESTVNRHFQLAYPGVRVEPLGQAVTPQQVVLASGTLEGAHAHFCDDSRVHGLQVNLDIGMRVACALLSKRFLILTGLAGSGKTKIAHAFAHWITKDPGWIDLGDESKGKHPNPCYALVPVGADWTGSENILGYPNGLDSNSYITKPALDVVLHASANPELPHFLILDEMNLSHVERYFADLLSMIESEAAITLYCDKKGADGTPKTTRGVAPLLTLPKNLFIIGTVNVDETTYMFSPKVLDRAHVIEFRMKRDEISTFLDAPKAVHLDKVDGKGDVFSKAFVRAAGDKSREVPKNIASLFKNEMLIFFEMLQQHHAEFGYRTSYEAGRFVHFYKELGGFSNDDTEWLDEAMDAVVFQKLLPKLHGSRAKLGPVLKKLWFLCVNDVAGRGADALKSAEEAARSTDKKAEPSVVVPAGTLYPLSAEKIGRMWRLLIENGFASFAEA